MSNTLADLYPLLPWHVEDRYDICDSEGPIGSLSLPEEAAYAVTAANLCNGDLPRIAALLRLAKGIPTEELQGIVRMRLLAFETGDSVLTRLASRPHVGKVSATRVQYCVTFGEDDSEWLTERYLMPAPSLPADGNVGGER